MYTNTNLLSDCECVGLLLKNKCLVEIIPKTEQFINMEIRRHVLNKFTKDVNFNSNGIRHRKPLESRKEEVTIIKHKFPTKIPIIVTRYQKEKSLPQLDKSKYLVPQEITMSHFITVIRNRMQLGTSQALYLLVNNRSMLSMSLTLSEVYREHAAPDGYLYITYASQDVFGA